MATSIVFNGSGYSVPAVGDSQWGPSLSSYLIAISTGTFQKTGGNFILSAEVNFGNSFGLKAVSYKTTTANPSTVGVLRLSNSDSIGFRNAANSANLLLATNANNTLNFRNFPLRFSVVDFGAVGDGSTDDTAAIQACFDAARQTLSPSGLGLVYFPATRQGYRITDSITIDSSVRGYGDNSHESLIIYDGADAIPMFIITVDPAMVVLEHLGFDNTGSATMAVQVNASNTFFNNVRSNPTVKFSTAIISTAQASDYVNNVVISQSQFFALTAGNETPIAILFQDGFGHHVNDVFVSGIPVGIKVAAGTHGGVLGPSFINYHYESFDGLTGPGGANNYGILVDGAFGLNVSGMNNQITIGSQRAIKLVNVTGASITGCDLLAEGDTGSCQIEISGGSDVTGVNIEGNNFFDNDLAGIYVSAAGSDYYVGKNSRSGGGSLLVSDAFNPLPVTGVFRLPNASSGVVWRNAADSADLGLTVDSSNQLAYQGTFYSNTTGINAIFQAGGAGGKVQFLQAAASGKFNWQLSNGNFINHTFEVTPSTAADGTTFSTPAFEVHRDFLIARSPDATNGGAIQLKQLASSGKYNFQLANGYNTNNVFEITPSTAVDGSTFSSPLIKANASSGVVTIGQTSSTALIALNGSTLAAGAAIATLTNAPTGAAGNPDIWIQFTYNGVTYVTPAWTP